MEQVENDRLVAFIVGKVYPTDCNKDSKRRLREKAASFLVIDGELHHKGARGARAKGCYREGRNVAYHAFVARRRCWWMSFRSERYNR